MEKVLRNHGEKISVWHTRFIKIEDGAHGMAPDVTNMGKKGAIQKTKYKFVNGRRVRALKDKYCLVCNKLFLPHEFKNKLCSHLCYAEWRKINKFKVDWTPEMRKKMSEKYMGKGNPAYGKKSWNSGKKLPQFSGENHPFWKGGFHIDIYGYKVLQSIHTNGKKILEHRKIMAEYLGRELRSEEIIHHINGDKLDNRIENLQIVTRSEHINMHRYEL